MSTTLAERISLRSPAALCCAVPHLLGFHPRSSAVFLWLRRDRILLTQRLDLPASHGELADWTALAWRHDAAGHADELVLLVVVEGDLGALEQGVAAEVEALAVARGIMVRDIVAMVGDRWTSLLCRDASCCPPIGHAIPTEVRQAVDTEFTLHGSEPRAAREDLLADLTRDEVKAQAVALTGMLGPRRWRSHEARERWREGALANLQHWLRTDVGEASSSRYAHLLLGLRDVRVRDTLLWEVSRQEEPAWRLAEQRLTELMRAAPVGDTAPAATCAAVLFWLSGDGVRARGAADVALLDDPGYTLGLLLQRSIDLGLAPSTWLTGMRELSRDTCRHGDTLQSQSPLL
jgi:hypothetical protein